MFTFEGKFKNSKDEALYKDYFWQTRSKEVVYICLGLTIINVLFIIVDYHRTFIEGSEVYRGLLYAYRIIPISLCLILVKDIGKEHYPKYANLLFFFIKLILVALMWTVALFVVIPNTFGISIVSLVLMFYFFIHGTLRDRIFNTILLIGSLYYMILNSNSFDLSEVLTIVFLTLGAIVLCSVVNIFWEKKDRQIYIYQAKLNEMMDQQNRFFSLFAHDLRNPLTVLMGYSNILYRKFDRYEDDKKKDMIGKIDKQTKHLAELVESFLEWFKSTSKDTNRHVEKISVEKLIGPTVDLIAPMCERKNIALVLNLIEEKVCVDKNEIETCIRNIITNAVKFSPTGAEIQIKCKIKNSQVHVSIEDRGPGLKEADIKSLNLGNFVGDSEIGSNGEEGTGLGLNLCIKLLESNEGKLHVENLKDIDGAKFTVSIPLCTI